jgi:hypothetical protein
MDLHGEFQIDSSLPKHEWRIKNAGTTTIDCQDGKTEVYVVGFQI